MGKGGQDREFGKIQLDVEEEIDQPFDGILGMAVESEQNRALDADAVVVVALDPLADVVRGVEHRLIHVPGPGLGGEVEDLVLGRVDALSVRRRSRQASASMSVLSATLSRSVLQGRPRFFDTRSPTCGPINPDPAC